MTTLRQRLIEDLQVRNRSPHTIRSYVACIAHFARHFGKSPELLGPEEIRQYQVYLVNERRVSLSYLIQIVAALRFLYCVTLQRDWAIRHIAYPKQPKRLPVVLSQAEVRRLFDAIRSPRHLAILMTAYAAGLRLSEVTLGRRDYAILLLLARLGLRSSEVLLLELDDIDWEAGRFSVRAKGGRRTELPLPNDVGKAIAAYLRYSRPASASRRVFLRGKAPIRGFLGPSAIGSLVRNSLKRAGIKAPTNGAHQFRHALATQMLRYGASLTEIGELLGHRSPETTKISGWESKVLGYEAFHPTMWPSTCGIAHDEYAG